MILINDRQQMTPIKNLAPDLLPPDKKIATGTSRQEFKNTIELLSNISCFRVTLLPQRHPSHHPTTTIRANELEIQCLSFISSRGVSKDHGTCRIRENETEQTRVTVMRTDSSSRGDNNTTILFDEVLSVRSILQEEANVSIDGDGSISLRLPFVPGGNTIEEEDMDGSAATTNPEVLSGLRCKYCDYLLLMEEARFNDLMTNSSDDNMSSQREQLLPIRRVFPLPEYYWDEISDYLMCGTGGDANSTIVNFSSTSIVAIEGCALEDPNVLCLHRNDLQHRICSSTCIEGYGDRDDVNKDGNSSALFSSPLEDDGMNAKPASDGLEYRGERKWKDAASSSKQEQKEGANDTADTVCCSQCFSILGFLTPPTSSLDPSTTVRIYKHRVCIGSRHSEKGRVSTWLAGNTLCSFVAREMVRYAESQAVYTFMLVVDSSTNGGGANNIEDDYYGRHLILHLLSYDTKMAMGDATSKQHMIVDNDEKEDNEEMLPPKENIDSDENDIQFNKIVKVIYEERKEYKSSQKGQEADDFLSFWRGADPCCPPPPPSSSSKGGTTIDTRVNNTNTELPNDTPRKKAAVRIYLSQEEWMELRQNLTHGSSFFSKSVKDLTLLLKLGKADFKDDPACMGVDLSMLQLPS